MSRHINPLSAIRFNIYVWTSSLCPIMSAPEVQLPNPFTPMAFLPPDLAFHLTVCTHIVVGTTAVIIWDIINNLSGDYRLLFKHKIGPATIAYIISRISTLIFVLSTSIFLTLPTGNCTKFDKILDAFFPVSVPASSLLFFFRMRAVFAGNNLMVASAFFLWLVSFAGTMTVAFGVEGINIGPTNYCVVSSAKSYIALSGILPFVHDTFVLLSISWKMMMNTYEDNSLKNGFRTVVFGDYLPAFSRALLQDGQMYYLVTVCSNLLAVVMVYMPVPIVYRTVFSCPNTVLMNIMACRVYRNTKFGLYKNSVALSTSRYTSEDRSGPTIPLAFRNVAYSSKESHTRPSSSGHGIEVTKTVHHEYDISAKKMRITNDNF